jgi:hypothetical protein
VENFLQYKMSPIGCPGQWGPGVIAFGPSDTDAGRFRLCWRVSYGRQRCLAASSLAPETIEVAHDEHVELAGFGCPEHRL